MTIKTQSPPDGGAAETFKPAHQGDEHWGKGGRYVVIDGKRVPAPPDDTEAAPPAEAAAVDQPAKKGK